MADQNHPPGGPWRVARRMSLSLLFILGCVSVFLLSCQHKLIYFPRAYDQDDRLGGMDRLAEVDFEAGGKPQRAFYVAPRDGSAPPEVLWVVFSGNATCALDWRFFAHDYPDAGAGFLLIDYPGYGESAGRPSPRSIRDAANAALPALAGHLGVEASALEDRLCVVGHSLGAAVALRFAADHPVRRVVAISPFTTMKDMAGRTVGWPLKHLLLHNFDNRARLDDLAARAEPPSVVLIHGSIDEIIPVAMGRELAARHPSITTYIEIEGGDHNMILDLHEAQIWKAMRAPD